MFVIDWHVVFIIFISVDLSQFISLSIIKFGYFVLSIILRSWSCANFHPQMTKFQAYVDRTDTTIRNVFYTPQQNVFFQMRMLYFAPLLCSNLFLLRLLLHAEMLAVSSVQYWDIHSYFSKVLPVSASCCFILYNLFRYSFLNQALQTVYLLSSVLLFSGCIWRLWCSLVQP